MFFHNIRKLFKKLNVKCRKSAQCIHFTDYIDPSKPCTKDLTFRAHSHVVSKL